MANKKMLNIEIPEELRKKMLKFKEQYGINMNKQTENGIRIYHATFAKGGAQSSHPQVIEVERTKRD